MQDCQDPFAPKKELAPSDSSKPKKKSIKPLPIIVGVFLAAAVAVFCGWTFARADIIRFFLGNTRYAAAFAKGTVSSIAGSGFAETALIYQLSHSLSTGKEQYEKYEQYIKEYPDDKLSYQDYENLLLRNDLLSALQQILPENGIYIKAGFKAEPQERLRKLAADTLHTDIEKIEKAFADLNHTAVEGNLAVNKDGVDLSYLISQKEDRQDSGDLYYNIKECSLYYLNPSLYSSALRTEIQALHTETEKNYIDKAKTEKERKALIKELSDIYLKHLGNAVTYYSNTVEIVGKGEFKGKSMSVTFENYVLIELLRDLTNAFYDSSYFNTLLTAAFDGTVPDRISAADLKKKAMESLDDLTALADYLSLTITFYINTDNSFAGLSLISESIKADDRYTTQIKYINTKTDIYAEVTAGENTYFNADDITAGRNTYLKVECTKSSDRSGTMNISINLPQNSKRDEEQNLNIAIVYSDLGHKKVFGKNQLLGTFNIDVSGSLLDELSLRSDAIDYEMLARKSDFTLSAKDSEKGIEYEIQVKNEFYGNVTVTAEIGENQKPVFDKTGMTLEEAVDLQQNAARTLEAKIGALKHIRELCGGNGLLKVCFEYTLEKNNIENIDEEIEKLENELKNNE